MRISIATVGCKVNQFESQVLEASLLERGHAIVPFGDGAEAVILNSCTVTHRSDRDVRALVRRARRANPASLIVVAGCYAQVDPQGLRSAGADLIVGTSGRDGIPDLVESGATGIRLAGFRQGSALAPSPVRGFLKRARAYLKVQDGCECFCAYCIVPYARGPSRSLPPEDVRDGLRKLREDGRCEVVLTGVHLGLWGRDLGPPRSFAELLEVAESSGVPRIRLSSLEPREVTNEVVAGMARTRSLCPHLHIPLQSGSDRILSAMGRPYRAAEARQTVERALSAVPELCLGFDVIVGFPGEDDTAFEETRRFLEELPLGYLHVFPFSPRQGTRAWEMAARVPGDRIRERAATLRALSRSKRRRFWERNLGAEHPAVCEGTVEGGSLRLRTRNYVPVRVPWEGAPPRGEVAVRLVRVENDGVRGTVGVAGRTEDRGEGRGPVS